MNTRDTVKIRILIALALFCLSNMALAGNSSEPTQKSMQTALKKYLAQQGNFCLGKFDWPIDVSEAEFAMKTKDALQMPVLEKLSLVAAGTAEAPRKVGDTELLVPVKRYVLTETGKAFYLPKQTVTTAAGKKILHTQDFCAGKLSLNKVVRWEKPEMQGDSQVTTATYTFKIAAAKWTHDPEIQKVFPMLALVVNGEGTMQLKQQFRWTGNSWEPVYPWDN
jgi:hypothetical protein